MNEMGKEELLLSFDEMERFYFEYEDLSIDTQILMRAKCYKIRKLITQKPLVVTRMQVRKLYSEIYRGAQSQKDMRDIIIKWLKELGIEVEK